MNKHHHEPLKKKKEQDEKRRREQEIEMLVSAGQLPPTEQADFAGAPQVPKVQSKEPEPPSAVSASSNEEVEAPTAELRKDEQSNLSPPEVIPNKYQDASPPSTDATINEAAGSVDLQTSTKSINPEVTVPDDVVRAARAAPRLVPPFAAEENIAVEEGRLAEELVVGVPKSRFGCDDEFVNE